MLESIKNKLWHMLERKEVSLALFFNKEGRILWHRGRKIIGKTVQDGDGFSKTYIIKAMKSTRAIEDENILCPVTSRYSALTRSAQMLKIKSIIILPVRDFFLYIDSGIRNSFNKTDIEIFKVLAELLRETVDQIEKNGKDFDGISGESQEIQNIRDQVLKYSLEEEPVLLLGETGSGKSHVAGLVHRSSGRKGKFFTIHCPTIPENLFESEIFGHKKGAFTDAKHDKKGYIDEAQKGTLFFDEISEVPLNFQAKLLRFIETKQYMVLGDTVEKKADIRIVAASNKDLRTEIEAKRFREDLFFRLQVLEIRVPPLRERTEDIKCFVLENIKYLKGKKIGAGFWKSICDYDWPGNIRELITVLKRAGIHAGETVTGEDIRSALTGDYYSKAAHKKDEGIKHILEDIAAGKSFWEAVRKPFLNRDLNRGEVKTIIRQFLDKSSGKYKDILANLNIKPEEHKKFLNFINDNGLVL